MKKSKHFIIIGLCLIIMLMQVACSEKNVSPDTTSATTEKTTSEPSTEYIHETPTNKDGNNGQKGDKQITYFSMSIGDNYESIRSLTAYPNEDGTVHVEYVGDEKKVGDLDSDIWGQIADALTESGLDAINGRNEYLDGEANGSVYISYGDDSYLGAGFSGAIPEEYRKGYDVMDRCFNKLTSQLPVYVPKPIVMGEVHIDNLTVLENILQYAELYAPDSYVISEIPKNEYFAMTAGLSSDKGILRGVSFSPMMMTEAFSLVIVTLEENNYANSVAKDFENNLDWGKWVCVMPDSALIAQKDNMVLCMMGGNTLFNTLRTAIENAGWSVTRVLNRPAQ